MKSIKTQKISLSNNDKLSLISNFCTMLSAGIPILETVDSLLEDSKGNQKKLLETVREDLMQGQHLHSSFSKFPKIFNKVTINIIKASEEAGTLEETLKDLKGNIREEMEFTDKIKSALIYPIVIFMVFLGVLTMILVVVVPKISKVFINLKMPLPLPTKVLIFASNTLLNYTIPVLLGLGVFIFGFILLYKAKKRVILNILFSLPLVSTLIKEIDLTRFTRSLYLLLSSGLTITNALELTQDVVMRKDISKAISHSKEVILAGGKLSEGLKDKKDAFPGMMIKIVEAGERSGSLDRSMQDTSEFLDYQVSKTLKSVTVLLEPIMLVGVGVLVGAMMLSIIAPIYGLIGQVGVR